MKRFKTVLATGTTPFSADHWHTLTLGFHGSVVTGSADGKPLFSVVDTAYATGLVGLGSGWNFAQYSNLKIVPNVE